MDMSPELAGLFNDPKLVVIVIISLVIALIIYDIVN